MYEDDPYKPVSLVLAGFFLAFMFANVLYCPWKYGKMFGIKSGIRFSVMEAA